MPLLSLPAPSWREGPEWAPFSRTWSQGTSFQLTLVKCDSSCECVFQGLHHGEVHSFSTWRLESSCCGRLWDTVEGACLQRPPCLTTVQRALFTDWHVDGTLQTGIRPDGASWTKLSVLLSVCYIFRRLRAARLSETLSCVFFPVVSCLALVRG